MKLKKCTDLEGVKSWMSYISKTKGIHNNNNTKDNAKYYIHTFMDQGWEIE